MSASILSLSGMLYHGGKYTAAEWKEKTGTDPRQFPEIKIHSNGLCLWTEKAEAKARAERFSTGRNWAALGVRA
jgi:hypothetical protein